jgi:hypothetical protein
VVPVAREHHLRSLGGPEQKTLFLLEHLLPAQIAQHEGRLVPEIVYLLDATLGWGVRLAWVHFYGCANCDWPW